MQGLQETVPLRLNSKPDPNPAPNPAPNQVTLRPNPSPHHSPLNLRPDPSQVTLRETELREAQGAAQRAELLRSEQRKAPRTYSRTYS